MVTYNVSISFEDVYNGFVLLVPEKDISAVTSTNYVFRIGSKEVYSFYGLPISVEI